MAVTDKSVFKAAFEGASNSGKFRLRDRGLVRAALNSPYLLDLVCEACEDSLPEPAQLTGEFGDGSLFNTIADRIGKWFMWIIENQDKIIEMIRKIIALFV